MLLKIGSTGSLVKTLQKLLQSIGFEIVVDGIFGSGTDKVIRLFQENADLKVDGLVGNLTYNSIISTSKLVTKNYKEKAIWLSPKDLKGCQVKANGTILSKIYKSFINGTFFYFLEGYGNHIIGWLVSEGKCLASSDHNRYHGTFIVKRDGSVICKRLYDSEIMELYKKSEIWFCIQGFDGINANPSLDGYSNQEVGRKCLRPIIGFNPKINKVLIAVFNGDYKDIENVANKYGCTQCLALDAGGSCNFYLDGKVVYSTSRILQNVVYW